MDDYGYKGGFGVHTLKVTFQSGEYKGSISYDVGGNSNGLDLLNIDVDDLAWVTTFKENDGVFKVNDGDEEWFNLCLKDGSEEVLLIEDEMNDLSGYIVAVEIVDYRKD